MKRPAPALALALALVTMPAAAQDKPAVAVFAGGCFWCMEPPFDTLDGVLDTTSGYAGGALTSPSYEQVSAGGTGHAEAVQVTYDPDRVTYADLQEVYWHNVDPVDTGGQFCDRGSQYRSALFPMTEEQRRLGEASRAKVAETLGRPVATTIEDGATFWPAEGYHQDYAEKNPIRYTFYRFTCGRDRRLAEVWDGRRDVVLAPE